MPHDPGDEHEPQTAEGRLYRTMQKQYGELQRAKRHLHVCEQEYAETNRQWSEAVAAKNPKLRRYSIVVDEAQGELLIEFAKTIGVGVIDITTRDLFDPSKPESEQQQ